MVFEFSNAAQSILRSSGWQQKRQMHTPDSADGCELFPLAREIVASFGGLHVGDCGPGIDCATSDVHFDPSVNAYLRPELTVLEDSLGTKLFVVGEVHRGHGFLVIDENGKAYLLSDKLQLFADTFTEALESLLLGRTPHD